MRVGPGAESQAWRWDVLRVSGALTEARMGHSMHAPNRSCLVLFGGSGKGRHLNDVVVGVPNRLGRPHLAEAAADEEAAAAEEAARAAADDEDDYVTDEADEAPPPEGSAEAASWVEDDEEVVVVRTRRTADTQKAAKRKRGKRRGVDRAPVDRDEL